MGRKNPLLFASRTWSVCEKINPAQIKRETVSFIFGVNKFHKYLYDRKFTLVTDHKPLISILEPKFGVPTLAAAPIQRLALILSSHHYDILVLLNMHCYYLKLLLLLLNSGRPLIMQIQIHCPVSPDRLLTMRNLVYFTSVQWNKFPFLLATFN